MKNKFDLCRNKSPGNAEKEIVREFVTEPPVSGNIVADVSENIYLFTLFSSFVPY